MMKLVAPVIAVALAGVATPAAASLTVMTPVSCAPSEYLIGVSGLSDDDWIYAIRPVCESWNAATSMAGLPRNGPTHGGRGGGEGVAICPRGSAVSGWEIGTGVAPGDKVFLRYVAPQCRTILPPREIVQIGRLQFGHGAPQMPSAGPYFHGCGPRELGIGISVAVGDGHVSNIDLTCRFAPGPSPQMSSRDTGRGTRLYTGPTIATASGDDVSLDWCREWSINCGQPAANAFCQANGQRVAVAFERAPRFGVTAVISGGRICGPACDSFRSIECGAVAARDTMQRETMQREKMLPTGLPSLPPSSAPPASSVTYTLPAIAAASGETAMLDYCREWGSACGKPAADAFCRAKGHKDALSFEVKRHVGRTVIIGSGAVCADPNCDGFSKVECDR